MLLLVTLFCIGSAFGLPLKGTSAPALTHVQLIQAEPGSQATWGRLQGKVVVLEFWATWCAPCIAGLPHFNELAKGLDPARFQFISVDDEDPRVVRAFLARKGIAGWVGVDTTGSVFARYGVKLRPTAIIVDSQGKIVAATEVDNLHAADLEAVAHEEKVVLKPAMEIVTKSAAAAPPPAANSLFSLSFGKASPGSKLAMQKHPPTGTDFLGIDAATLLTYIYDPIKERVVIKSPLSEGLYSLRVNLPGVPEAQAAALIQTTVFCGLHIQVRPRTIQKREYILRSTDASKTLLSPSTSSREMLRGYWDGKLVISNGSMDDLAFALETALENPVVNQTGITGKFDARIHFRQEDLADANAELGKTLGLELVTGTQDKTITLKELVEQAAGQPCTAKLE